MHGGVRAHGNVNDLWSSRSFQPYYARKFIRPPSPFEVYTHNGYEQEYINYTKYTKYIKCKNVQDIKIAKITKYELWNLYIIQNENLGFRHFVFEYFTTFSKKSKVFWHCWPVL